MNLALIPLLPAISFVILILIGRRLGKAAPLISLSALLGSLVLSIQLFLQITASHGHPVHASMVWLPMAEQSFRFGFLADPLSITMCLVVTVIGWMIMLYSTGYMTDDPRYSRFFAYLSLFFAAMLTLVLADHFVLLYIGWEVVGLCSYLLISFWFEKPSAAAAGKKAFLTTRVGDLGLLAAILLMAKFGGNLNFGNWETKAQALGHLTPLVAVLLFWGAAGKSAQFPLHVWLPDAMEGPTPVSALIHAATMVAAGVYLVARCMPLFLAEPSALMVVATLAAITSFFAATIACTQTDLKKILAYSTLSQLGFMMLGLASGSAVAGMFHLVTHAWFKALLFLGAGSVIHAMHHQDTTKMGGLLKKMPITGATFIIASVAMAGVPPLSGFWSKEEILISVGGHLPPLFLWVGLAVSLMTAFYITKTVIVTFFGECRDHHAHAHESPWTMAAPLLFLSVGAAFVGLLGSPFFEHSFQHFLAPEETGGHSSAPAWIQTVSVLIAATGIGLAFVRYQLGKQLLPERMRVRLRPIYQLIDNKYYIDEIYEKIFIRPVAALGRLSWDFDAGVVDAIVNGVGRLTQVLSECKRQFDEQIVDGFVNATAIWTGRAGQTVRLLQTGLVQNYLWLAAAGAVALFFLIRR